MNGDSPYADRSMLRAVVWEVSGGLCEHPLMQLGLTADKDRVFACRAAGAEMAHIYPRGMGHTGYRDTLNNVICVCRLHARSTDDLSSDEWAAVAVWAGASPGREEQVAYRSWLRQWTLQLRRSQGWDITEGAT